MADSARGEGAPEPVEDWELELIIKVALAFRTDREELEAELARKLLVLKARPLTHVRNWKGYLAKFLYNKASNWVRDTRARTARERSSAPSEQLPTDRMPSKPREQAATAPDDLRLAVGKVFEEMDPELRRTWELLVAENGNQLAVARKLGKHRNTIRLWVRKIRQALERHGLVD